jgi:hypothetical protein
MKSSTTRKTKKKAIPRLLTTKEAEALTLRVVLWREGWVLREENYEVKSVYQTQAEAISKGRTLAKKRSGQLVIHGRNGEIRKIERYWGAVRLESLKPGRPASPPVNATRKEIERVVKQVIRERLAREAAQQAK